MKLLLLVLAVSVGVTLSFRIHHSKRHRRDQAADEAADRTAMECIKRECKSDAMNIAQPFMLFSGGDPKTVIKNITSDEAQLTKICDGFATLVKCPKEKCTLSSNMEAYIDANDVLHYLCEHKADIVAHASCIIDAFSMQALQQSCAAAVMPLMQKFEQAQNHYQTVKTDWSRTISAGGAPSFSELKRALEALPELTCTEVMPLVNCVANPAKEKCGEGAKTLLVEFMKEISEHSRKFYEKIAPGNHFLPDLNQCAAADNTVNAIFKFLF